MINIVVIQGYSTKDLQNEVKKSKNGNYFVRFRIGWSQSKDSNTSFINCVAFGDLAQDLKQVKKGDLIRVNGKLIQEEYKNKNGDNVESYSVVLDCFSIVSRKDKTNQTDYNKNTSKNYDIEDYEIPF